MKYKSIGLLAVSILLLVSWLPAQTPNLLNYQGKLTAKDGMAESGIYTMIFSIYSDSSGVTRLWTETHAAVVVNNGIFNVLLGSVQAFQNEIFTSAGERYLGIRIGSDPEMRPIFRLASVPYAIKSFHSDINYQYSESEIIQDSKDPAKWVDTDVSVTIIADGFSAYLILASCDVGNDYRGESDQMLTLVGIFRGDKQLNYARQRVQYAEPAQDENVSLFHIDKPPSGLQTYKLRYGPWSSGRAIIASKRLLVMKLK